MLKYILCGIVWLGFLVHWTDGSIPNYYSGWHPRWKINIYRRKFGDSYEEYIRNVPMWNIFWKLKN